MSSEILQRATAALEALSTSNLSEVTSLCHSNVTLFGTDADEQWFNRDDLLAALAQSPPLRAHWETEPVCHGPWVAGTAMYTLPGETQVPVRVSMVFDGERLTHAHFSAGVTEKLVPPDLPPA